MCTIQQAGFEIMRADSQEQRSVHNLRQMIVVRVLFSLAESTHPTDHSPYSTAVAWPGRIRREIKSSLAEQDAAIPWTNQTEPGF